MITAGSVSPWVAHASCWLVGHDEASDSAAACSKRTWCTEEDRVSSGHLTTIQLGPGNPLLRRSQGHSWMRCSVVTRPYLPTGDHPASPAQPHMRRCPASPQIPETTLAAPLSGQWLHVSQLVIVIIQLGLAISLFEGASGIAAGHKDTNACTAEWLMPLHLPAHDYSAWPDHPGSESASGIAAGLGESRPALLSGCCLHSCRRLIIHLPGIIPTRADDQDRHQGQQWLHC